MKLKAIIAAMLMAALPPAALAQSKPPIKLGNISSLTGPLGLYGKTQEVVVRIAVEDINAKGGVNGSLLQVDTVDAQLDPGQAVLLFRKFANEGYFGVVGPITGTQWETVSPLANQIGLPAIAPNASKPGITKRPWTIRLVPADDTLIPEGFDAFRKLYPNIKRVAIVADFQRQLLAQHAALGVDVLHRLLGALAKLLAEAGVVAGHRAGRGNADLRLGGRHRGCQRHREPRGASGPCPTHHWFLPILLPRRGRARRDWRPRLVHG